RSVAIEGAVNGVDALNLYARDGGMICALDWKIAGFKEALMYLNNSLKWCVLAAALTLANSAVAQFQPFGMDIEWISVGDCNPNLFRSDAFGSGVGYCPQLEAAVRAGAQFIRILTMWRWLEPNPPTGVPDPGTPGHRTGQHTYGWDI